MALGVVLSPELVSFLLMIATGAVLFYQGFVIRTALDCTIGTAIVFLAADLVAVMLINATIFASCRVVGEGR